MLSPLLSTGVRDPRTSGTKPCERVSLTDLSTSLCASPPGTPPVLVGGEPGRQFWKVTRGGAGTPPPSLLRPCPHTSHPSSGPSLENSSVCRRPGEGRVCARCVGAVDVSGESPLHDKRFRTVRRLCYGQPTSSSPFSSLRRTVYYRSLRISRPGNCPFPSHQSVSPAICPSRCIKHL